MYQNVAASNDNELKSIAYQQLGVMSKSPQTLQESLRYLKASLKANPYNEEARYDYEVVKRLLDQQSEQQQDQENQDQEKPEPSEFAKELKRKADNLRAEGKFKEAYNLMMQGYQQDQTVAAYQDYIGRLKKVAEI